MAIRKIQKSEIDFNKVYGSKANAAAHNDKTVKVNEQYWGDTGDLYFDDETGMVSEDGIGIGFVNEADLLPIEEIKREPKDYTNIKDTKAAHEQKRIDGVEDYMSFEETDDGIEEIQPILTSDDLIDDSEEYSLDEDQYEQEEDVEYDPSYSEVDIEDIVPEVEDDYVEPSNPGNTISVPGNIRQTGICRNNEPYDIKWNKGTNQAALHAKWVESGKTTNNGIATYNGLYIVAVSPKFGRAGDQIDVNLKNGEVIHCIIGDAKGSDKTSEWGHELAMGSGTGVDIIEWCINGPSDNIELGSWRNVGVDSITNYGSLL